MKVVLYNDVRRNTACVVATVLFLVGFLQLMNSNTILEYTGPICKNVGGFTSLSPSCHVRIYPILAFPLAFIFGMACNIAGVMKSGGFRNRDILVGKVPNEFTSKLETTFGGKCKLISIQLCLIISTILVLIAMIEIVSIMNYYYIFDVGNDYSEYVFVLKYMMFQSFFAFFFIKDGLIGTPNFLAFFILNGFTYERRND